MRNIMLDVSYDGTAYAGFQIQPNLPTVQGELEEAVRQLTGERVKITASGRTDAAVHARKQVVNFVTESSIPIERWALAMNTRLPNDIVVQRAELVPLSFHARRSAKRKTYRYSIQRTKWRDVFHRSTRFHHPAQLDVEAMREALRFLEGEHDFSSFCSTGSSVESHVRTIFETGIELLPEPAPDDGEAGVIHIYMTGSGFLYNMVRIIVGTLLEVGTGKREPKQMKTIIEAKDRRQAGPTAVARGLMLWNVEYDSTDLKVDESCCQTGPDIVRY
ncbi:tRNA pseudouridine(38-40) synthase TruA [Paenibacillus sp. J31TS4]|uniref:tRNA pseudouridine(38-40) synthase TruA n=1 Tax=Paenibacillus sp. J31TS4 TaxID=2807195 RepID=UPI001BCB3DC8|nr:tRNA pseudouridine(38-40) synthase TruA [Paenibacillus sp. J31TS4]